MTFKSELNSVETLFFNCFVSKKKKKRQNLCVTKGNLPQLVKFSGLKCYFPAQK